MSNCETPVSPNPSCRRKRRQLVEFTLCDAILTVISLAIYIADIITDVTLGYHYIKYGHYAWGVITIVLCFIPMILTQIISIRWYIGDLVLLTTPTILLHFSLLGMIHRYFQILFLGFQSKKCGVRDKQDHLQLLHHHQSDLCLLRLFESFLESAPQLLLQLYIMHELQSLHFWTGICAFGSLVSLAWGIASYARIMRNAHQNKNHLSCIGLSLQAVWRIGTIVARMTSLLMCASVIHTWFFLAFAVHWLAMTVWTLNQKTDLCTTAWEERIYNSIVGVIYCFCFFNLKDGQSRHRAMVFYTIMAAENAACLAIFMQFSEYHMNDGWFHAIAPITVVTASVLGHTSQLVYYRWFHPSGHIQLGFLGSQNIENQSVEEGCTGQSNPSNTSSVRRTLKHISRVHTKLSDASLSLAVLEPTMSTTEKVEVCENAIADFQQSNDLDLPNEDSSESRNRTQKAFSDSKLIAKIVTCTDITVLPKSKSDGQLGSTLGTKLSEIVSNNDNTSNNDEAPSDVSSICLSVHDYENMPVFNVNRADWGIRHWKSYSDIENSYHDNSISKEKEPFEQSIASVSSSDSNRVAATNDSHKISIEEAISQLKSLAINGSNVYQRAVNVDNQNNTNIYEYIWLNQMKACPSTGHNLSTITEESETSSNKSSRSKSSLVQTVETLINTSLSSSSTTSTEDESQLTYVEVSFLSKLASSQEDLTRVTLHPNRLTQFEPSGSKLVQECTQYNKENIQSSQPTSSKPRAPLRNSSLSPNGCIISSVENNSTVRHFNNLI